MKRFFLYIWILFAFVHAESLRMDAQTLLKSLSTYKVVDTRDRETFLKGHIKGAVNFPISLSYADKSSNGKLVSPTQMQSIIRSLGIDEEDRVVIYDNGGFFDASRLFWALEVYGFKNVKLLSIGYDGWMEKGYPTEKKELKRAPSRYVATVNSRRLATKFTTQLATKNPNSVIVDSRTHKAYIGLVSTAKRYGHIPKAMHIPASHNIDYTHKRAEIKNLSSLQTLYKEISKDKKVIIYCDVGRIAATNYFALRELGYDVANYDASWREWGNDFNLPVVNLSKNP